MTDARSQLDAALDQASRVLAAVKPDQADQPTPCGEWDVRALVRHLVNSDLPNFAVSAKGEMPDWSEEPAEVSEPWSEAFDEGAEQVRQAWRDADLDRMVPGMGGEAPLGSRLDQQIAELAMHTWDLARATGQQADLDPALAEKALAWSRPMLKPEFRGADKAFGDEVPVDEDADAYDRLAGWFGRDPAWRP